MVNPSLAQQTTDMLAYLEDWHQSLQPFSLRQEVRDPRRAAVFAADLVVGFCSQGSLASPRVHAIVPTAVSVFQKAYHHGVRHFILCQDTHSQDAEEFHAFPPHCIQGSQESQTVEELRALPFSGDFLVMEKNSLHPSLGNSLDRWLDQHLELQDLMVVGDCTDLCVYSVAMHLRLRANAHGYKVRVILPIDAVQTYDMPITSAKALGALAHPGDLFHLLFLYHMALNGIQVVKTIL
ncbi:MAG: isochorismatase family protein [Chloroflexi bacterium]|nr:isochorismatase family protein [Chloroflexota bacterium]